MPSPGHTRPARGRYLPAPPSRPAPEFSTTSSQTSAPTTAATWWRTTAPTATPITAHSAPAATSPPIAARSEVPTVAWTPCHPAAAPQAPRWRPAPRRQAPPGGGEGDRLGGQHPPASLGEQQGGDDRPVAELVGDPPDPQHQGKQRQVDRGQQKEALLMQAAAEIGRVAAHDGGKRPASPRPCRQPPAPWRSGSSQASPARPSPRRRTHSSSFLSATKRAPRITGARQPGRKTTMKTLCAEWTMIPIHALSNRREG